MNDTAKTERYLRILGTSLIVFGLGGFVSSIAMLFISGRGMVDLLQVVVILIGFRVTRGSERAVYWATLLTALYAFVSILLTTLFMSGVGITLGGNPETTIQQQPWHLALLVPFCAWTTANFLLCLHIRRRWRRIKRGQCASCGYSLRGTPHIENCPECGATA